MSVAFGTSGLRGMARDLTDVVIQSYVHAFILQCTGGGRIFVGQDLRSSSPRIAQAVIAAAQSAGLDVIDCGAVPTPALALAAQGACAIMVTGSHIPADRNGLKFYTPTGEITKSDEAAILGAVGKTAARIGPGSATAWQGAGAQYCQRYQDAFGPLALSGLRLGIYQHSGVSRDILADIVTALGATAVPLGRSDRFIPIDTEALDLGSRNMLQSWAVDMDLDAILSTDGDGDRPLLTGKDGRVIAGDILGVLTAQTLGAEVICTPVSANSMIDALGFGKVIRCKIGSPYVIAAMTQEITANPAARAVGFEPNGGFILGFDAQGPAGPLPPLMTRDAVLPLIAPLAAARAGQRSLKDAVSALPARATAADRLTGIAAAASAGFLARLSNETARAAFLAPFGQEAALNTTDGLRIALTNGTILHLRPSGNAPEFRIYVEAQSDASAQDMLHQAMLRCAQEFSIEEALS